jgi:hypothetical protein
MHPSGQELPPVRSAHGRDDLGMALSVVRSLGTGQIASTDQPDSTPLTHFVTDLNPDIFRCIDSGR